MIFKIFIKLLNADIIKNYITIATCNYIKGIETRISNSLRSAAITKLLNVLITVKEYTVIIYKN